MPTTKSDDDTRPLSAVAPAEYSPQACRSIHDVRQEIDRLDRQLVALMGSRLSYVKAAAKFKRSEVDVRAPERFAAMLQARRRWAGEEGLEPAMVEALFRSMVNHFIEQELSDWGALPEQTG